MAISVHWHNDALRDLTEMIDYYEAEGAIQAPFDFREKLVGKIDFILKYPSAGRPTTKRKNIRYILIGKHRRMYYRHTSRSLTILAFFDTRQHPGKGPY